MSLTNFPDGISSFGVPILGQENRIITGNVFFVDSVNGLAGNDGSFQYPVATITQALAKCTANNGDVIFLKPGHAETVIAAAGIDVNVAGITILGTGYGALRPTITFSTAVTASVDITANDVTIRGIIGLSGIDALTQPFNITGDNCILDIEWQDASATVEAERVVLATTVSNLFVKIKYVGFITGNACVNVVRLVAVTGARIIVDVYGEISTGIVEMITTASTDVLISGYFYNDNVALTKNVVNTGGLACTWFAYGYDGKGGYNFSGGSSAALASDDTSTIIATLGALNDAAAAGAVTNVDTVMAYLKQLVTEGIARDGVIGALNNAAATGAVTDVDTLMAYIKQLITELQVVDGYFDAPTADAATDTTIRDAIGRKTDTNAGTSLMAKQLVPTADVATNINARDVIGNKADAAASGAVSAVESLMAYVKQLVTELAIIDEFHDVPAADNILNAQINEVIGNKEDATAAGAVTTTDTLVGYIKQLVTAAVADAALSGSRKKVISVALAAADITGTVTRFTITGGPIRILALGVWVSTAIPAGANTLQFGYTPAGGGGANTLSGATDIASAAADQLFLLDGTKATGPVKTTDVGVLAAGQLLAGTPVQGVILAPGIITTIFSAGPPATGAITVFMEYEPMTSDAVVA